MTGNEPDPSAAPPPTRARRVRATLIGYLRNRLAPDPPALRLVFWDGEVVSFAEPAKVTITITSPNVLKPLLVGNFSRLGDAYVHGTLIVEGRAEDIVRVGVALAERIGRIPWLARVGKLAGLLPKKRTKARDAENIVYHYDVSNDFYRLWLDDNMIYSSAYFAQGSESLDSAQVQKLDQICKKLALKEGDKLLDIGCGWGGLLVHAATRYGISGVGITLSQAQRDNALAWVAREGLADRIEIRLQDYRDVPETAGFDKLVSIGMFEHVGLANLPNYFAILARLLKPGGMALNQGVTITDPQGPKGPPGGDFIDRYVFPGGELPHLSMLISLMATAGLEIGEIEDWRPHYAKTLIHWVRRLEAASEPAIAAVGAEKFRIWRVYLAGMALAFDRGWLTTDQVLAFKPLGEGRPAPRPWSLRHVYDASSPVWAKGLDWSPPPLGGAEK